MSLRHSSETPQLLLALGLVLVVIVFTATATLCGSILFVLLVLGLAWLSTRNHHADLLRHGYRVTAQSAPDVHGLVERARQRLQAPPVQVFVVNSPQRNAYTFGLSQPKVVVIYAGLLRLLTPDELVYVIGHELGHVQLGHTWLNSLVGGMAGIPSPFGAAIILQLAFRGWNRACEFSADRAGLVACGHTAAALGAMRKIAGEAALRALDDGQDAGEWFGEMLSTHPMMARRARELRQWAKARGLN